MDIRYSSSHASPASQQAVQVSNRENREIRDIINFINRSWLLLVTPHSFKGCKSVDWLAVLICRLHHGNNIKLLVEVEGNPNDEGPVMSGFRTEQPGTASPPMGAETDHHLDFRHAKRSKI